MHDKRFSAASQRHRGLSSHLEWMKARTPSSPVPAPDASTAAEKPASATTRMLASYRSFSSGQAVPIFMRPYFGPVGRYEPAGNWLFRRRAWSGLRKVTMYCSCSAPVVGLRGRRGQGMCETWGALGHAMGYYSWRGAMSAHAVNRCV